MGDLNRLSTVLRWSAQPRLNRNGRISPSNSPIGIGLRGIPYARLYGDGSVQAVAANIIGHATPVHGNSATQVCSPDPTRTSLKISLQYTDPILDDHGDLVGYIPCWIGGIDVAAMWYAYVGDSSAAPNSLVPTGAELLVPDYQGSTLMTSDPPKVIEYTGSRAQSALWGCTLNLGQSVTLNAYVQVLEGFG